MLRYIIFIPILQRATCAKIRQAFRQTTNTRRNQGIDQCEILCNCQKKLQEFHKYTISTFEFGFVVYVHSKPFTLITKNVQITWPTIRDLFFFFFYSRFFSIYRRICLHCAYKVCTTTDRVKWVRRCVIGVCRYEESGWSSIAFLPRVWKMILDSTEFSSIVSTCTRAFAAINEGGKEICALSFGTMWINKWIWCDFDSNVLWMYRCYRHRWRRRRHRNSSAKSQSTIWKVTHTHTHDICEQRD